MPTRSAALALLALAITACGGSKSSPESCTLPASLGSLGTLSEDTALTAGDYVFQHDLNADARPDMLSVSLYDGFGVFAAGVAAGTFTIDATEAQFATCGVCVMLGADMDPATGQAGATYMASGGTVTISRLDTRFVATLSGITFRHVTVSPTTFVSTPTGSCASAITSASIDSLVQ